MIHLTRDAQVLPSLTAPQFLVVTAGVRSTNDEFYNAVFMARQRIPLQTGLNILERGDSTKECQLNALSLLSLASTSYLYCMMCS